MARRRVIIFSLAVLVAAVVIVYLCIPKEPRYEGRSLSSWIDSGLNSYRSVPGSAGWQAADHAVVQIGTNGIPWLLKWASAKDSKTRSSIISRINSWLPVRLRLRTDRQRQRDAILGFQCLGPIAKPVWPVFVQWTTDSDPDRRLIGLNCLTATVADRETLVPVLGRLMKDPDARINLAAVMCFSVLYPQNPDASEVDHMFPMTLGKLYHVKRDDVRHLIFYY